MRKNIPFIAALLCLVSSPVLPQLQTGGAIEVWARHNTFRDGYGISGRARPVAVLVDDLQNVYVTGTAYGSRRGWDYVTVKYNGSGKLLWAARYDGPAGLSDEPAAMAIDDAGNVYVTGSSYGSGIPWTDRQSANLDFLTIKYDRDGREVWVSRRNGSANGADEAECIRVDASGNVYVAGSSYESATGGDCLTIKYDAAGNEVWAARYSGPGAEDDSATGLAVDQSGNVYVASTGRAGGTSLGSVTIAYDQFGMELQVLKDGTCADRLVLDGAGNAYKAGGTCLLKYDATWKLRWARPVQECGIIGVAVDDLGDVFVTGKASGAWDDIVTSKYDSEGTMQWTARYNGPLNSQDWPAAIVLDEGGNAYVAGTSHGSAGGTDFATLKYDRQGNQAWVARYGGAGSSNEQASALALDKFGNVYVSGEGPAGGYYTVKYVQGGGNILQNSDFESGTGAWSFFTDGTGTFGNDGIDDGSSKALQIAVTNPGSNIQLYQSGLLLLPDTRYRLRFQAYSSSGNDATVLLHKHGEPYTNYGLNQGFDLGTTWINYECEFTTGGFAETVTDGRLQISMAGHAQADDRYYFDDVYLQELGPAGGSGDGEVFTGVEEQSLPQQFALHGNYPNPFNPSTVIRYELPKASDVRLTVYDMLGREAAVLVDGRIESGVHEVKFDAGALSSGVYFYRLQAGDFMQTQKLQLIR